MPLDLDLDEFRAVFLEECFENLDSAETGLLNLDTGNPDPEVINTIFRAVHSIKGGSATFGFTALSGFAHVMETLMDELRSHVRPVTRPIIDLLLEGRDCLRMLLEAVKSNQEADAVLVANLQAQLEAELARKGGVAAAPAASVEPALPTASTESESPSAPRLTGAWLIRFSPHRNMLQTGNDPLAILRELRTLGTLRAEADLQHLPPLIDLVPEQCYLSWTVQLVTQSLRPRLRETFEWVEDVCDVVIYDPASAEAALKAGSVVTTAPPPAALPAIEAPLTTPLPVVEAPPPMSVVEAPPPMPVVEASSDSSLNFTPELLSTPPVAAPIATPPTFNPPPPAASDSKPEAATTSIRVSIDKVDALINLVGELVITQSMLQRFGDGFEEDQLDALRDGLNQLMRNTRELQETAMQIRMLPISASFNRFPRMVRDLSSKLGKRVELRVSGEHTELDKTVLERINDPLVHLVRNSLDHGVETPDIRKAAGKPEVGTIELNAYHQGGNIIIEVKDDGAGLNREKIYKKAVLRGLVNPDEELTEERIHQLIFQAGFSTAEQVSDVSGRGVGMDVVRNNIKELGGQVSVHSVPNVGSTFTIRLPLTLAILDGQLVKVGDQIYIIPIIAIVESLQITPDMVSHIAGGAELFRVRNEYIPVLRLYQAFSVAEAKTNLHEGLIVIVEADNRRVGIFVDDLLGQQQVVIKSLETNFRQINGLSGATILGDGMVALILDMGGLLQQFRDGDNALAA